MRKSALRDKYAQAAEERWFVCESIILYGAYGFLEGIPRLKKCVERTFRLK